MSGQQRAAASPPSYVVMASLLRERILNGELQPEERLPAEADLASNHGVSRSTVREALRVLAAEGLITTRRGVTGGSFVAHPEPDDVTNVLGSTVDRMLANGSLELSEVIDVWNAIEIQVAAIAARNADDVQIKALLEVSAPIPKRMTAAEIMVQTTRFHSVLREVAGNRFAMMMLQPLSHLARDEMMPHSNVRRFLVESNDVHREIAEAIAAHDERRTVRLMAAHMAPRAPRAPRTA